MNNQVSRTLVDHILWKSSPEVFRGQTAEQIEALIERTNREWESEYTGFSRRQVSRAASDLEHLANPSAEFIINGIKHSFKETKHPDGREILLVSWAKDGVISFEWTADCGELPGDPEEALDILVGCVWRTVDWQGRKEIPGQI